MQTAHISPPVDQEAESYSDEIQTQTSGARVLESKRVRAIAWRTSGERGRAVTLQI